MGLLFHWRSIPNQTLQRYSQPMMSLRTKAILMNAAAIFVLVLKYLQGVPGWIISIAGIVVLGILNLSLIYIRPRRQP